MIFEGRILAVFSVYAVYAGVTRYAFWSWTVTLNNTQGALCVTFFVLVILSHL